MALDQLRWQPWAYQLLLVGVAVSVLPAASARAWLRALLVSLYVYAALAKLDVVFVNTIGQQIVAALTSFVGIDSAELSPGVRNALAVAMPLGEGVVGVLLAWRATRRAGVVAACLLHSTVFLALGPLGLGHHSGVLLWNLVSAALVAIVFWPDGERPPAVPGDERRWSTTIARTLLTIAIAAPLVYPLGFWDRWPSWGLYAPRGERAELYVHNSVADRLPEGVSTTDPQPGDRWRRVLVDEWMLDQTGAPLYPQNRVVVALAKAIDKRAGLGAYVRVDVDTPAGRFNAERERTTLEGAEAIREYARRYWLSTEPQWTR